MRISSGAYIARKLTAYTDGAARGNPGPSASGFMIYEDRKFIHRQAEYNGKATNNYAEYKAVAMALRWCISSVNAKETLLELYSDNELVVRQLNGQYKIKSESLRPMNEEIKAMAGKFMGVKFGNVRRENIYVSAVDRSLNELLDMMSESDKGRQPK